MKKRLKKYIVEVYYWILHNALNEETGVDMKVLLHVPVLSWISLHINLHITLRQTETNKDCF